MPNVRTDQLANLLTYLVEHVVDQGRLARAEEARDHLASVRGRVRVRAGLG